MNVKEFSNEFDILYNNIMSNAAPGLNEYEKSVFLTQAQEEFVINLYAGRLPIYAATDETEETKRLLNSLVKTTQLTESTETSTLDVGNKIFTLPDDTLYVIYERAIDSDDKEYEVSSIRHNNYDYLKKNPFKGHFTGKVFSLDKTDTAVELLAPKNVTISEYKIRYLKRPDPIILMDISGIGATINGISDKTECELPSSVHSTILKIAVNMAVQAYKQ